MEKDKLLEATMFTLTANLALINLIILSNQAIILTLLYFPQGLKARGNVEEWLGKVEDSMFTSLRKLTKASLADYELRPREEWVTEHPSQV